MDDVLPGDMGKKSKPILIRVTTVPISLKVLLKGQLRFMSDYFEVIGVSSGGEMLNKVAASENVRVVPIQMTRKVTPFRDILAIYQMYRLFSQTKPHIVHSHTPKAGLIAMFAAKLAGVPNRLHTVAGLPLMEANGIKKALLIFVERLIYACSTNVYPNSKGLKKYIESLNITENEKLNVIGSGSSNGIDCDYYHPSHVSDTEIEQVRNKYRLSESDMVFCFIGRLVKDKGLNELVAAFSELCGEGIKLLLVGNFEEELDPLSDDTMALMKQCENIILTGYQEDVRPFLKVSDAVVFPSYREGFPNVPMQAGCFNLPCIVSDINGCNEIIEDMENGIIVPTKDVDSLKDAMRLLIDNVDVRQEMGSVARDRIVDNFSQRRIWEKLLDVYQKI